jgi:RNA polymerase sigma-70 factor, ECF subfamily
MSRSHQELLSRSTSVLTLLGLVADDWRSATSRDGAHSKEGRGSAQRIAKRRRGRPMEHPPVRRRQPASLPAAGGDSGDRKLVAAVRARDPAVARELWERFAPTVFRVLGRTLGPQVPLDDAVHEVFIHVLRGRSLRADSDLRLFVLKSTARVAYLCLRMGRTRWPRWVRRWRPRHLAETDGASRKDEGRLALFYSALDDLGPLDRIAFVLRFVEGLEVREVAAAVTKTVTWLEPRLAWILAKVTRSLALDRVPPRR